MAALVSCVILRLFTQFFFFFFCSVHQSAKKINFLIAWKLCKINNQAKSLIFLLYTLLLLTWCPWNFKISTNSNFFDINQNSKYIHAISISMLNIHKNQKNYFTQLHKTRILLLYEKNLKKSKKMFLSFFLPSLSISVSDLYSPLIVLL